MSESLKAVDTVIPAWNMATKNRPIHDELIFHSDRGVQYACYEFRRVLKKNLQVQQSMSARRPTGRGIAGTMLGIPCCSRSLFQDFEIRNGEPLFFPFCENC